MCYWNVLFLLNHNNGDMELVWSNHLFRETGPWTPKTGACCVFCRCMRRFSGFLYLRCAEKCNGRGWEGYAF